MFTMLKPYEYLLGALIIAAAMAFSYYKGYSYEHDKLVAYQAQVMQEAKDQAAQSAATDAKHKQEMKDAKDSYQARIARITAYYNGLRNNGAGSSVPQTSTNPSGTNGSPSAGPDEACAVVSARLYELQQLLIAAGVTIVH